METGVILIIDQLYEEWSTHVQEKKNWKINIFRFIHILKYSSVVIVIAKIMNI